jgi:putative membrane protein
VHEGASSVSVPVTLFLLACGLLYAAGYARLRKTGAAATSPWRPVSFLFGLGTVWLAAASPLARLDHRFLSLHMLQHLLLLNVAAPLLLLGEPLQALARVLPQGFLGLLEARPLRALGRFLSHPLVCWLAGTGVVLFWHVPAVLALTQHSGGWHLLQHASFLFAGLLFFWPVVLPWPAVSRVPRWVLPLYLFLATLPCDALSAFLVFCGRVVYPHYVSQTSVGGLSALEDQTRAGALMWLVVTVGYLLPAILITLELLSPVRTAAREVLPLAGRLTAPLQTTPSSGPAPK